MSPPTTPSSPKDTSDLSLINKMLTSNAPPSPTPTPSPSQLTPSELRKRAAAAAEPCAKKTQPDRVPPPVPLDTPKKPDREAPKTPEAAPPPPLPPTQDPAASKKEKAKKTRWKMESVLRRVRETMGIRGVVSPEMDDEDGDERGGEHMMSGALQGGDRSERELGGRRERKSRFREEFGEVEAKGEVEGDGLGAGGVAGEEGEGEERGRVKAGKVSRDEKRRGAGEKETIKLTRARKRTTTEDGRVVKCESKTEYYESVGPPDGCVAS